MDKIGKVLRKLTAKEQRQIKEILIRLQAGFFKNLDVKKLKGHEDIFRVRKGTLRIIYRLKDGEAFLLAIERRSEKTYKNF